MANTSKTTVTKAEIEKENEALKKTLEETQAQLTEDAAQVETLTKKNEALEEKVDQLFSKIETMLNESKQSPITDEIGIEDPILVISLVPHSLNLYTDGHGQGTPYLFSEMGEEMEIPFGDLRNIVRSNKEMAANGRYYIADERAVKKLRIQHLYKNILTPEAMTTILNQGPDKVIELYKMANEAQQKIIIDMIMEKRYQKEKLDANLVQELSALIGEDLMQKVLVDKK